MTLRTMNSRNVTTSDAPQDAFEANTGRPQPRDYPIITDRVNAAAQPSGIDNPELLFEIADGHERRTMEHDAGYPSPIGSDEICDSDDRVIMVVDDDHAIREALKDLLGLLGFQVVSARDGEDALAMLRDGCRPYAILLDLGMPRMDGWRFRSELLSDPRYAGLRVIVITASEDQHPEALAVSDVLTKPVPLQKLVEVLGNHEWTG